MANAVGIGQAICADPSPSKPPRFSAKEEPPEGSLARDLLSRNISDLRVVSSHGEKNLYTRDQSEIPRFMRVVLFKSMPDLVVQPSTSGAAAAALKFAADHGLTAIPRGAASSPFGGSVPVSGGMVIDTSRMDRIAEVDTPGKTVTVQGGVRWADLDHELGKRGLRVQSCPSSKFSTVGGWVATGGIGINSYSRGHLSKSVLAYELAITDGSVRRFTQADADFGAVFGSEGQLGVVTSVTLQVCEVPKPSRPHLFLFDDTREALAFTKVLMASKVRPAHVLFESANRLVIANQLMGQQHLRPANAVVVSVEGEESEKAFAEFAKGSGQTEEKEYLARFLWNERFFPMKVRKLGPGMLGTEVVMPSETVGEAIAAVRKLCSKLAIDPMFEIHYLSDGDSLFLCFFTVDQGNTMGYTVAAFESLLLSRLLIDLGGKPYSMGIWNMPFSDAEDRSHIKRVKDAKGRLDPKGVMNSGKFFYLSGRFGPIGGAVLHPRLMRPLLRIVIAFAPLSTKIIRFVSEFARRRLKPESRTEVLRAADDCAMCGACVPVCPAYLMMGDERVTARGKLQTAKAVAGGMQLTKEHAHRTFLCMRCKACEQVCQSKLDLIPVYEKLEAELERVHGKDAKEIEAFVRAAECSPEYDALVAKGLVLGAPKHGTGGVKPDV